MLTSQLIRMEWAADSEFVDLATLAVQNRRLEVPDYSVETVNGWLHITTKNLEVYYLVGGGYYHEY